MITILKQPQKLQPVYNEIIYVCTSSLLNEANFNFLGKISAGGLPIASIEFPVNPDGYGVFDIHRHLQGLVDFNFNPTNEGFKEIRNSYVDYDVEINEKFRPVWSFQYYLNLPSGSQFEFWGQPGEDPNDYFNIGDTILVQQTPPYAFEYINGEAVITNIIYEPVFNIWKIVTNKLIQATDGNNYTGIIVLPNFQTITIDGPTITDKHAFNGVLNFKDFINWDYVEYDANQITGSGKWLTNVPSPYNIQMNSRIWLNVYSSGINDINYLKITTAFNNYYLENPLTGGGDNLFTVNVSPESLNNQTIYLSNGQEAIQPIFTGIEECYSVSITNNIGDINNVIDPTTFCIKDICSKYEDIQLVFMDKLGSFIPFHFNLVNRHTKKIDRTNYQKDYGKYAPASNNWEYNTWDRGTKTLSTAVTEEYRITSDWLSQELSDFFMILLESPEVYWIQEDGTTYSINLTVNNVERKQVINDQLVNYTLTFEMSNKNKQQLG